jgi:hypothetical protein
MEYGGKDSAIKMRFSTLRASLGRRPLIRLLLHSSIALVMLTLIIVFAHQGYVPGMMADNALDLSPGAPGMREYHPPSSGPAVPPGIPPPLTAEQKKEKSRNYYEKMTNNSKVQSPVRDVAIGIALQQLFQPILVDPASPEFQVQDGDVYSIADAKHPIFTKSLGKRICIVDIDGRSFDGQNEAFSELPINIPTLTGGTSGILNHYLYAKIHGYSYYYIKTTPAPKGRGQVWEELRATLELMETDACDYIFSLDTDAVFVHLELPVEWMLNRWNMTDQHAITLSIDPDTPIRKTDDQIERSWHGWTKFNRDDYRRVWANPGVSVLRNSPIAREMLRDWWSCPEDHERYPRCERFIKEWPAEMSAFANYIRYEEKYKDTINEIACQEANGFPQMRTECVGLFIKHFTTSKDLIKSGMLQSLQRGMTNVIHQSMFDTKDMFIKDQWKLKEQI